MKIANIALDKRLLKINGREVSISLSAELDQDNDLETLRQSIDYGDARQDALYFAKFKSGELINLQIKVVAKLEGPSGFISGEETLSGVHVQPFDYDDPEAHDIKSRVMERLEFNGIIDAAIGALAENIRKTLEQMGFDEDKVDVAY